MWMAALGASASVVSITTYKEWGDATYIRDI
jgi:hypothetical protein